MSWDVDARDVVRIVIVALLLIITIALVVCTHIYERKIKTRSVVS